MNTIKNVQDFKNYINENHDLFYRNVINADDISETDDILKEDEWDKIYQQEIVENGEV